MFGDAAATSRVQNSWTISGFLKFLVQAVRLCHYPNNQAHCTPHPNERSNPRIHLANLAGAQGGAREGKKRNYWYYMRSCRFSFKDHCSTPQAKDKGMKAPCYSPMASGSPLTPLHFVLTWCYLSAISRIHF